MQRVIVHLDADAFFASVEQAADTRLRGKPIAVGGEKRGIVASASYEARKFGIYTPMPTVRARKLCPKLIVVPGDFEKYEQFSRWMFSYAYDHTPDVEISSIDEGYFDLTGVRKPPLPIAEKIREAIKGALKITVSEGIGANKLVSQIASKLNKPAAFEAVPFGGETKFLHPLPNKWLPGVGPTTAMKLNAAGLIRIGHVANTPLDLLQLLMGNMARSLKEFANGIDERPLIQESEPAKSYSHQETFGADQTDEEFIEATLKRMADSLMAQVREDGKTVRTLTVKVRYNDMAEDQSGESLLEPTDLETDIYGRIRILMKQAWRRRVSLRMVSLRLSNIYNGIFRAELALERSAEQHEARRRLASAVDQLRQSRGKQVVLRGHDFQLREASPEYKVAKGRVMTSAPKRRVTARTAIKHYLPLNVHSYYSFLNSTLSVEGVVNLARRHELPAMALTDDGNLHGAAEFVLAAKKAGIKPILGTRVKVGGIPALFYVENTKGYHNLCHLLSVPKELTARELEGKTEGLLAVSYNRLLAPFFPGRFYFAVNSREAMRHAPREWPCVAALACRYGVPGDRWKYDVVQSIRTLTLLKQEHPEKIMGGQLHFRSPMEMQQLFGEYPELLVNTNEIAERCSFEFPFGPPQFPRFTKTGGLSPKAFLREKVMKGLEDRYKEDKEKHKNQVLEELSIIEDVGYEEYFLVMWDILQKCKDEGIEWITRGSAADSLVCYCLGISSVCPIRFKLYFRRFLNKDRMALNKLPDIDVDFPHDRKDDVIDLIFKKYGAEKTAIVGGFSTYQARGAVADVAKVLGVSDFQVRRFTEHIPHAAATNLTAILKEHQECRDMPLEEDPYKSALEMAEFLDGFPRYAKMHPCGLVLSRQPIHELTPTFISNKGYPTTHYDMDAVEMIGLIKMDVLAQGGLAVMRDMDKILSERGIKIDLGALEPWQDEEVWEMIASGGARAVHHIESPAMVSLCRMCDVWEIDGLIAIVSVIRPGAANEQKKIKFSRRYQEMEPPSYPHPSLEECLKSTYGLVVYEEHILQICEAFAGLPPGRADVLRRALNKYKYETIEEIRQEFFKSARDRGHVEEIIKEVWELASGFEGYAFCKAHSTAYGIEAYQSAWLKLNYPVEFMAAVLSAGKGFYHPIVYVLETHRLGIKLLSPCVNDPGPNFIPLGKSIRVPIRYIKGITAKTNERILREHMQGPFESLNDFYRRVGASSEEMELLFRVGAFDRFGKERTEQFWECQFLKRAYGASMDLNQGWLLPPPGMEQLPDMKLEKQSWQEQLKWEDELLGFPVSGHPLDLHQDIAWDTYCLVKDLGKHIGEEVVLCGLIIEQRIHNQVTGELMKFLTLADWTGIIETELFAKTYRSYGLATVRYPVLEVTATVEPYENGRGHSLRVHRAGKPRLRRDNKSGAHPDTVLEG
jgi:DNA-directed DNA polymerase III PolC